MLNVWDIAIEAAENNCKKLRDQFTNAVMQGSSNILELEILTKKGECTLDRLKAVREQRQAELTGDTIKIARARQKVREAELRLLVCTREAELQEAESTGDTIKIARAQQKVREAELQEAESTGDTIKIASARYHFEDARLEMSVATAEKALSQACEGDVEGCQRRLDFSLFALQAHGMYGHTGNFFTGESEHEPR